MSRDNQQRGGEAPSSRASQSEAGSFSSRGSSPSGSMSAWSCCPSPRSPNNMAFCHKPPPSFVPRIKLEALKRQGSVESSSSLSSSKLGDHDSGAPKIEHLDIAGRHALEYPVAASSPAGSLNGDLAPLQPSQGTAQPVELPSPRSAF